MNRGRIQRLFYPLLILFILVSSPLSAKPLREILNFEEFKDLLCHMVKKIPDIENYWQQYYPQYGGALAGGPARGLIHWVYMQLQHSSPTQVRKMKPPSTSEQGPGNAQ